MIGSLLRTAQILLGYIAHILALHGSTQADVGV